MFACYVQECQTKFMNPEERRDHCITSHKFPHNFRFDVKTSSNKTGKSEAADDGVEATMEAVTADLEETKKPLKSIHFGHSKVKTFKSDTSYASVLTKNQKKKSAAKIFDDNQMVVDLIASLPE